MPDEREISIKKMMEACDKDPALRAELLKSPGEVAARFKVTLKEDEKAQIAKVAELFRVVDEFKAGRVHGPGPIYDAADVWWKRQLVSHIIYYRPIYYRLFYHIYYWIGYYFDVGRSEAGQTGPIAAQLRRLR